MNILKTWKYWLTRHCSMWRDDKTETPDGLDYGRNKLLCVIPVAEYNNFEGKLIEHNLKPGEETQLKRERKNPYDRDAVAIYALGQKIGYIPHTHNPLIALLLDQNEKVTAFIYGINDRAEDDERVWVEIRRGY